MALYVGFYSLRTIFVKHTKEKGFRLRRQWARLGTRILGIKNTIEGSAELEPALYVINHRSLVDPMIIAPYLNAFVVAKAEVASYPVLGYGAAKTGIVFVKRDNKDSRSATIDTIREVLKRGDNVMIFPEGTINLYKLTKEYKLGSFRVAAELGVPIIPVVLEYRDDKDLWTKEKMIPQFLKQFGAWNTYTKTRIGDPIYGTDGIELMEKAQAWTDAVLTEMHEGWTTMKFHDREEE